MKDCCVFSIHSYKIKITSFLRYSSLFSLRFFMCIAFEKIMRFKTVIDYVKSIPFFVYLKITEWGKVYGNNKY